jgi:hypothetical protein
MSEATPPPGSDTPSPSEARRLAVLEQANKLEADKVAAQLARTTSLKQADDRRRWLAYLAFFAGLIAAIGFPACAFHILIAAGAAPPVPPPLMPPEDILTYSVVLMGAKGTIVAAVLSVGAGLLRMASRLTRPLEMLADENGDWREHPSRIAEVAKMIRAGFEALRPSPAEPTVTKAPPRGDQEA